LGGGCVMSLNYKNNKLYYDNVLLENIVKKYKTPLYVYSYNSIKENFLSYDLAFGKIPHLICFAMKTNSNMGVLNSLAKLGSGIDAVSGGEIFRAIKAGVNSKKIVYAGVGKTEEEIDYALKNSILMFNVESISELNHIQERAKKLNKIANISLRVNPDVNPKTHPYISTGLIENKFGIGINRAIEVYLYAKKLSNINVKGIHMHIGSQIVNVSPYSEAIKKVLNVVNELKKIGINLDYFNIGGGLGIQYKSENTSKPNEFIKKLLPYFKNTNLTILVEPGRSIIGNAGIFITKVLYNKNRSKKNFVIVDAGMNDLIRPAFYDAYHDIIPMNKISKTKIADVVGPICESSDFLAKNRKVADVNEGECLVLKSAGAYCFSMSSNYNSRLRLAEVMIKNKKVYLIREREKLEDLIKNENML
jgi:diaminopimelate decarboxylase